MLPAYVEVVKKQLGCLSARWQQLVKYLAITALPQTVSVT